MPNQKVNLELVGLASVFRGFYARVADRLKVDLSYVSRVARGECQSDEIIEALEHEMVESVKLLKSNESASRKRGAHGKHASRSGVVSNMVEHKQAMQG